MIKLNEDYNYALIPAEDLLGVIDEIISIGKAAIVYGREELSDRTIVYQILVERD